MQKEEGDDIEAKSDAAHNQDKYRVLDALQVHESLY
jgi:hypothetical protein